ncbi:hypothetical protein GCM10022237_08220 [Nocardioides ginsengisoli]|uniref:Phage late control D family protein n=1 Tax=Nocardioides ginsengisoli TaxID=363868 RepID=A0ABW3VZE2_9ACTN
MTELTTLPGAHPYASHAPIFTVDHRHRGELARDLLRMDVCEGTLGLRTLVVHLHAVGPASDGSAGDLSYLDGEIVHLGSTLDVTIGPPSGERKIFHGVVSALELGFTEGGPPIVSLYAEDALMKLRISERTARYESLSDADIVREVASAHGLAFEAHGVTGPTNPLVQQWEESDLAFARGRAVRLNAELWADDDDKIHLAERGDRPGTEITLVQGNELIAAELRADVAHQRTKVTYRGWDDKAVEAATGDAEVAIVQAEVAGGGKLGPDVVGDIFSKSDLVRSRRDTLTSATARAYAEAEMRRRARGFVTVEGTTSGTPELVPGAKLDLRRVGRPFEGAGYRCTYAQHSYDLTTGYRTRFRAERPELAS